jgi:hypothetical protein
MYIVPCILIIYMWGRKTCIPSIDCYNFFYSTVHLNYINISSQQDATMCSIYSLFHCKVTVHVSGAFYTHHQEYRNCSRRPLVQVICHYRLDGVVSNPLENIHSQVTNTLHHGQVWTRPWCSVLVAWLWILSNRLLATPSTPSSNFTCTIGQRLQFLHS